jgi:hypothetical protein
MKKGNKKPICSVLSPCSHRRRRCESINQLHSFLSLCVCVWLLIEVDFINERLFDSILSPSNRQRRAAEFISTSLTTLCYIVAL